MKSLTAFAIFGFLATGVMVLLGLAPTLEAREPVALAKGDRLAIGRHCAQQVWPNFDASCLHSAASVTIIRKVRVVNAQR